MKSNKRYKALILDLDGTTIPNKQNAMPSNKVVEAIGKAQEKIFVGVATGRPYYDAKHIIEYLHLSGVCIVNNGAQIIDASTGAILLEQMMLYEDMWAVCKIANALKVPLLIDAREKHISINEIKDFQNQILGAWTYPSIPGKLSDLFVDRISHISTIAVSKTPAHKEGEDFVIISHASATKQYGILEVAKILGIDTHEMIGVGDGDNDFPLLMACGLRVAMGNAGEGLKAIADYVAPSVLEDGVVDVINKFVL